MVRRCVRNPRLMTCSAAAWSRPRVLASIPARALLSAAVMVASATRSRATVSPSGFSADCSSSSSSSSSSPSSSSSSSKPSKSVEYRLDALA
eukprot:scaffold1402_cov254-Pinguiococcus_pyrenoidosus.AAC.22